MGKEIACLSCMKCFTSDVYIYNIIYTYSYMCEHMQMHISIAARKME